MTPTATAIFSGLEFRKPMMLRNVEPLSDEQLRWRPGPERVSIAWQLWHIAEVEENWISLAITGESLRFPFGVQVRDARDDQYPSKHDLIEYFHEVRALTRRRLEDSEGEDFDRVFEDPDFGPISGLQIWAGVVTSFAWHAGQIALTAKLLPDTPVTTLRFEGWREGEGGGGDKGTRGQGEP